MCAVSDATLLSVANYTLNDEAGRVERLEGVETKFYSLQKYNVIASAFVFAIEVVRGKVEVFSFILVLPYSEMSDYLARHSLCETRVQKMLQNYFILPLQDMVRETHSIIYYNILHIFPFSLYLSPLPSTPSSLSLSLSLTYAP